MSALVAPVPVGSILADTDSVISAAVAAELKARGIAGAIRYLSRSTPQQRGDLSAAEAQAIRAAGLGLCAVQHVAAPRRWLPSAERGMVYGAAAVANARACGLPPGVTLALDLEDPAPCAPEAVIAYVNAWERQIAAGGFEPMLYVGPNCLLDGEQLYWDLRVALYWRSASRVPDIPMRGYAMAQSLPRTLAGIAVDLDTVIGDAMDGCPHWWAPA